ncbi:hypothetical protein PspLS_01078 [Pyricularia sp. CBS 133598]|nr:hypothetical protein PspLS_01078 [Pyricularia sp. CBS 133598]
MHSRASSKRNQRRFSIESQVSTDSILAPKTDSPATPAQAHLSHVHDDPIQPIQGGREADRLVSYYQWQIHHQHHHDKSDPRAHNRLAESPWQDQEALWSMAATRRRELEKRNRRIQKLWIGCAAALVVVIIIIVVVLVVLGNQGMLSY